jgi:hypothetical protein
MANTRRIYPMPEAVDGRRWTVGDGRPQVDMKKRSMLVPLANTDADRFLRAHETAHARITPHVGADAACKKHSVSMLALQTAEDNRVHYFLGSRRVPTPGALSESEAETVAGRIVTNDRDSAAALLSVRGTGDFDRLTFALTAAGMDDDRLESIVDGVRAVERIIQDRPRRGARDPRGTVRGFKLRTVPGAQAFEALFPEDGGDPDDGTREMISTAMRRVGRSSRPGVWGDMQPIHRVAMTHPRKRGAGETRTYRDEGVAPTAVYRLCVDGRIFSRTKRAPGGTVLVDASGSMSLSNRDLSAIVDAAPSGTVAVYDGDRTHGRISIVAHRGRQASMDDIQEALVGGGNVIDGPALRWLANQPKPRIWVSDGMVTGKNDMMAANLLTDAVEIQRRGGIRRVDRAADVANTLKALRAAERR